MDVYPAPGHCHDHIVLFDPRETLMIVADAFMGSIFRRQTRMSTAEAGLKRMLALDIEILIEGHGFIHPLRADIPDIPGVLIRRDPKEQLCETLQYLKWLRERIEDGFREGLPICAIEATCFPGAEDRPGNPSSTTNSCGDSVQDTGSRTELVRSLVRRPQDDSVLPLVHQARIGRQEYRGLIRKLDRSRPLFG